MWPYKGEVVGFQENLRCFETAVHHFNSYIIKIYGTAQIQLHS